MNENKPFRLYVLGKHGTNWDFYSYETEESARTHMWDAVEGGKECAFLIADTRGAWDTFADFPRFYPEAIKDVLVFGVNADVNMQRVGWPKLAEGAGVVS